MISHFESFLLFWILPSLVISLPYTNYLDPYASLPALPSSNGFPACSAKMWKRTAAATYSGCSPFPASGPIKISDSAIVGRVEVTLFLDKDSNPALRISFRSQSPDSAQEYTIKVWENGPLPFFCGNIRTPAPNTNGEKVVHYLGVEMFCPSDQLQVSTHLVVTVSSAGGTFQGHSAKKKFQVPGCSHKVMRYSKQCKELNELKVRFTLEQEKNGTIVVILDKDSAYQDESSVIHIYLLRKERGCLDGLKDIGKQIVLTYPQTTARFENLLPGKTYSVQAARERSRLYRTSQSITIKRRSGFRRAPRARCD